MMWENEEIEAMDTSDIPWGWYYLADCGRWHRFEEDPHNPFRSEDIEKYYLKNSKAVINVSSSSYRGQIDFSAMLQTDLVTRRQRKVQRGHNFDRSCSCHNTAPVFWEKVDLACPYQLIPLSELTPEYECVASYVKNDGQLDRSIVSISRIQNLDLWEIFCRKKLQLMRILGIKEIEERRLFHGTESGNVDYICKYNFDLRLAGQHGRAYGKGIYFAKQAKHADKYSKSSTDPLPFYGKETQGVSGGYTKIIVLARVMIGKSVTGLTHYHKPDHGKSENTHYSCVNDMENPQIYIVFDPNQIYPEYLIQYR